MKLRTILRRRGDDGKTAIAFASRPCPAVAVGLIMLGGFGITLLWCQTAAEPPLAFEVASIKPHPVIPSAVNEVHVVVRMNTPTLPSAPRQRFSEHMTTVETLIAKAYDLKTYQILGLPDWAKPYGASPGEYYDIDAITPMSDPNRAQMQTMLQSLLAERFELRVHPDMRELPAYELVAAKGGVKFKPIAGEPTPRSPTMFWLVEQLSHYRYMDRPIVDRTDLSGHYDFPSFREAERPDSASSLSAVLKSYLGLELKPTRERTQVLVVEHVQRPSPN